MTNSNQQNNQEVCTSRGAREQERNALAILRSVAPLRRLLAHEQQLIAELQANRLLELAGQLTARPVPTEIITGLPRVVVRPDYDLTASATTQWLAGRWLIVYNPAEPGVRIRFSLAHEAKHVIDHRHIELLYETQAEAEAAADYFAACLWMPKRAIHKAWAEGTQGVLDLARLFAVSPAAMSRRLQHLGLHPHATPAPIFSAPARQRRTYQRLAPTSPRRSSPKHVGVNR